MTTADSSAALVAVLAPAIPLCRRCAVRASLAEKEERCFFLTRSLSAFARDASTSVT